MTLNSWRGLLSKRNGDHAMNPHLDNPSTSYSASAGASLGEAACYVLAATALSTLISAPLLLGIVPEATTGIIVPLAQLTPLIVALIFFVVLRQRPQRRIGRLRDELALRWGGSSKAIFVGLGFLLAISAIQALLALATGSTFAANDDITLAAIAVIPVLLMQCVFALGEELGWRGWLASRTAGWSFTKAAAAQSLAWTAWHLPVIPLILSTATSEFALAYLLSIASWAPFFLALRLRAGSVWPAVVLHGGINSIRVFILQSLLDSGGGINWWVEATGVVLWLAAASWVMNKYFTWIPCVSSRFNKE